jgi:hypothetical protein
MSDGEEIITPCLCSLSFLLMVILIVKKQSLLEWLVLIGLGNLLE